MGSAYRQLRSAGPHRQRARRSISSAPNLANLNTSGYKATTADVKAFEDLVNQSLSGNVSTSSGSISGSTIATSTAAVYAGKHSDDRQSVRRGNSGGRLLRPARSHIGAAGIHPAGEFFGGRDGPSGERQDGMWKGERQRHHRRYRAADGPCGAAETRWQPLIFSPRRQSELGCAAEFDVQLADSGVRFAG